MSVSAFAHDKYPPARICLPKISARSCRSSDCDVQMFKQTSTCRVRLLSAPLQDFNDPLSRYAFRGMRRAGTSSSQLQIRRFLRLTRVRDFHPIPLFSKNKNACPIRLEPGRAYATKAEADEIVCCYYSRRGPPPSSPNHPAMRFFYYRASCGQGSPGAQITPRGSRRRRPGRYRSRSSPRCSGRSVGRPG